MSHKFINSLQINSDINEFERILSKNRDLKKFLEFYWNNDSNKMKYFRWLPISTANVERSFSRYKSILTDKRTNFKPETVFKIFLLLNT